MASRRHVTRQAMALAVIVLALLTPALALAQQDDQPVVYAILLYSPTCPHCHEFIENEWPKMHEEFGDQFQLLFINVQSEGGRQLAMAAYDTYNIPDDQRYVPMMIIGDEVLVGGYDIPTQGREIIRAGLESGGIDLPPVPGLREAYEQALAQAAEQPTEQAAEQAAETPETLGARLSRDPLANALAVGVLMGLVASTGAVVVGGVRVAAGPGEVEGSRLKVQATRVVALVVALAGLGMTVTLAARTEGNPLATLLAVIALLILAVSVFTLLRSGRGDKVTAEQPSWLIPAVALAGLAAAVYLASVEVGQGQAACGLVGDCNTVQQSPYATLFGIIPVGVLGVVGYVAVIATWIIGRLSQGVLADLADAALLGMTLFGAVFSAYLTYLEPFIIGATCAWCLTSALIMLLLLWLQAAPGWRALRRLSRG